MNYEDQGKEYVDEAVDRLALLGLLRLLLLLLFLLRFAQALLAVVFDDLLKRLDEPDGEVKALVCGQVVAGST